MVSDLSDSVDRIFPCIKRAQETKVGNNGALEQIIEKTYEVILDAARFICNYVQCTPIGTRLKVVVILYLQYTGRATNRLVSSNDQETIEELGQKLSKLVEDFDRVILIETREAVGNFGKFIYSLRLTRSS